MGKLAFHQNERTLPFSFRVSSSFSTRARLHKVFLSQMTTFPNRDSLTSFLTARTILSISCFAGAGAYLRSCYVADQVKVEEAAMMAGEIVRSENNFISIPTSKSPPH